MPIAGGCMISSLASAQVADKTAEASDGAAAEEMRASLLLLPATSPHPTRPPPLQAALPPPKQALAAGSRVAAPSAASARPLRLLLHSSSSSCRFGGRRRRNDFRVRSDEGDVDAGGPDGYDMDEEEEVEELDNKKDYDVEYDRLLGAAAGSPSSESSDDIQMVQSKSFVSTQGWDSEVVVDYRINEEEFHKISLLHCDFFIRKPPDPDNDVYDFREMYVTPPDTDVYSIPKVLSPMPEKYICCAKSDFGCYNVTEPPIDAPRDPLYKTEREILKMKWYYYVMLSLVDVEANFLVVKAYQYTSLTSVMLLDCWAIPSVILLTWIFLKTRYKFRQFAGVAICVVGLVLVVFSDVHAEDRAKGSNPLKGDMFVIAGSTLYAVSNVSEEFLVKEGDRTELMAMLGTFGAVVSACQISILERNELKSIHWTAGAVLPFVGFALAMFLFYSTVPILLKLSGSTMLNLSLLTSDMWAVLIRIFAYHEKVDWMYFIAFAAVAVGLVVYSGGMKGENRVQVAENDHDRDEESAARDSVHPSAATGGSSKEGDTKDNPFSAV